MSLPRLRLLVTVLLSGGCFLISATRIHALPEKQIRQLVHNAELAEKQANWEFARQIYESLLSQRDPGLRIRERYQHALRRCWQVRRYHDPSYRQEVLSIEYGDAARLYSVVTQTLLEGAIDKKKLDPTKLFRKGLEELDHALGDPTFAKHHLPPAKLNDVEAFRRYLRKTSSEVRALSRPDAVKQLYEIAMEAEFRLQLNPTVVAMEFTCGACYAIDEFTAYLTPNQLRELVQTLSRSETVGVGVTPIIQGSKIVIHQIAMDCEAAQLEPPLLPSDEIISVNKKSVVDLSLASVRELLEGPIGSTVEIEIMSTKDMTMRTVRLRRRPAIACVQEVMLGGGNPSIGYLRITGFNDVTVQDVDDALSRLTLAGMKGLILDLRGNSGGVLESSIETARRFLSTGVITSTVHQDSKTHYYHAKNPNAMTLPMVALVDGDTASAAELLAGALKDNNRAILIGQTTFGKGCSQYVLQLPNALGNVPTGGLKLTVARFFSPKGLPYSGRGVVPHIVIDDAMAESEAVATPMDPYIERAREELNRLLAMPKQ